MLLDLPISRDYFAGIFGALGITPNVRLRTASAEAVRGFVANGLGYSVLNHSARTNVTYDGKRIVALKKVGVNLVLLGFLHYLEEVEFFGQRVLPLVRQLERAQSKAA